MELEWQLAFQEARTVNVARQVRPGLCASSFCKKHAVQICHPSHLTRNEASDSLPRGQPPLPYLDKQTALQAAARSCGAQELVDLLHVLGLEDEGGLVHLADRLRRVPHDHLDGLARAPVHRAVARRDGERGARAADEAAAVRREGVEVVLHEDGGHVRLPRRGAQLERLGDGVGGGDDELAPLLPVEPLGRHRRQLLQVVRQVALRHLAVRRAVAPRVRREGLTRNVPALRRLPLGALAVDDALAARAVRPVDRPLVEPVLLLLRAHLVHPAELDVLLAHLLDQLLRHASGAAEVVLARRGGARLGRRVHVAAPHRERRRRRLGEAAPQSAERRAVVLILQVGVAVAHDAAAAVAAVELLVDPLELAVRRLRLLERRLAALQLVLLVLR
mmetsp:Transcript_17699/g.37603  ORF Transcript_17699/g.37603 Transcript_17699/m.37603 type:complete len:390 (+) Transcript_17699:129-1298(+)